MIGTFILIAINVAVFLYMYMLYPGSTMGAYYSNMFGLNPMTMNNPMVWVTSMFIHANLMHIGMNMLGLLDIGSQVEREEGTFKFLMIYFITGLVGSLFSYLYLSTTHAPINVVGASGAVFGVWAYLSAKYNDYRTFLLTFIGFHVFILVAHLPIAWYGHLGGAVAGLILGYLNRRKPYQW